MTELTTILERVERQLGRADASPQPLSGGITNRNYRVRFDGRDCVLRLPGLDTELLGIDRTAEQLAAERAASVEIGPPVLYADLDCCVTEFVFGTEVDPDSLRADPGTVARALRAFHESALMLPRRFWVPELLEDYARIVAERGGRLPDAYVRAQQLVARIEWVLPLIEAVPCHNDLLPGNLLQTPETILLVDWEYAGMGHRYFDLANLAAGNEFDRAAEQRLLEAYFGESAPPGRLAALRLFRLVSDAREAAWGVAQGVISDLDFDFGEYARIHFERLERAAADPIELEMLLHAATP